MSSAWHDAIGKDLKFVIFGEGGLYKTYSIEAKRCLSPFLPDGTQIFGGIRGEEPSHNFRPRGG